ncbi:hypothetical protein FRC12_007024 [Ceratobasidium sp. 428]|nr:hypothetical protein FRC12_007024 [Ceratobasidium sp. 428]
MASQPDENQNFPLTTSPTPVRDSQPRYTSPTTTRGTQRGHAELDTPPPGTQPVELRRSDRTRNLSTRGHQSAKHTKKPFPGHSNAPQPDAPQPEATAQPNSARDEPKADPKSRANGSQPSQKRKRTGPPTHKFDGEESTDEERPLIRLKPPRKRTKTRVDSPGPPKVPGHRLAAARQSERDKRGLRLNANATKSVFDLFGADPETTTTRAINEKILSLSDHPSSQVGSQGRYTKVRGEASAPLSPLNQKRGGYHRDLLLALGHPEPPNAKRPLPDEESGPSKRARFDAQPESSSSVKPAFRSDVLSLPSFTQWDPASASSTQRAIINAAASGSQRQPRASPVVDRFRFGAGLTPIPEPRDIYSQRAAARRAPSPAPRVLEPETRARPVELRIPRPNPRPPSPTRRAPPPAERRAPPEHRAPDRQPIVLVSGTPSRSPSPARRPPQPLPTKQSRSDKGKVPRRKKPSTPTESESEPEPAVPKSKRKTRPVEVGRAGGRSSRAAGPSTRPRQLTPPRHQTRPSSPARHHDIQAILDRLGDVLNGGDGMDEGESDDPAMDHVIELLMRRQQRACPPSSRREHAGPSSSRREHAGPSSSRREHAPSSSSRHQARSSANRHATRRSPSCDDNHNQCSGSSARSDSKSPVDTSRNGLSRYPGKRGKAASHAIPHLLSVAIRKGVFQNQDVYFKWARREYIRAWKRLYPKIKYKRPPRHLLRLMIVRISGLRTDIKKRVRPLMAQLHRLRNPGSSDQRLEQNRQLCKRLLPNAFHCRASPFFSVRVSWFKLPLQNLEADRGYYEHQHMFDVISEAFFSRPDSPVILHHKDFALLPLPAVAFVLTVMQDCLQEWDTGCQRIRDNQFKQQKAVFDAHLHGLNVYQGTARGRLADLQSDWFLAGMEFAGIRVVEGSDEQEDDLEFCQQVSQARFIEPDSDSEPEPEPEYNDLGLFTAQSKGKGKASGSAADALDDFDDSFGDEDDC